MRDDSRLGGCIVVLLHPMTDAHLLNNTCLVHVLMGLRFFNRMGGVVDGAEPVGGQSAHIQLRNNQPFLQVGWLHEVVILRRYG